jgi:dTDP-4-amino-4,6-dideoxygalactose transaminase
MTTPQLSTPACSAPEQRIPLFDPQAQYQRLQEAIDARVQAVMAHGRYVNGPEVSELETALCDVTGAPACITCANGTDALIMSLMAQDIGPGDAVFVPAFTYVATAGAVRLAGATPVFCDVLRETANLDPQDLARQVNRVRDTGALRPRAVIPVDLYGLPADYDAVKAVAAENHLSVIADAAQAMGAARGGTPVGALATVTTVSFFPTKPLACAGDGGAILTEDLDFADRCRRMRTHGTDATRTAVDVGMNNRLDTLQAAILLAKLPAMASEREHREQLARAYDDALDGVVETAPRQPGCDSAWALYTIKSNRRDEIRASLAAADIDAGVYYSLPVHLHPAYSAFGEGRGSLPVSERLADEVLSLPLTADMTANQVTRIADVVKATVVS